MLYAAMYMLIAVGLIVGAYAIADAIKNAR